MTSSSPDISFELNRGSQVGLNHGTINNAFFQHASDADHQACLRDLARSDPRLDKKRIEREKGGLLRDAYRWILDNPDFQKWRHGPDRLLWIKARSGKGKTMLLCGIIDRAGQVDRIHLLLLLPGAGRSHQHRDGCPPRPDLSAGGPAAVARPHVRRKYDALGNELFDRANTWEDALPGHLHQHARGSPLAERLPDHRCARRVHYRPPSAS